MAYPGGGFKYFQCSPLLGEDSRFDKYFSNGLKPPTSMAYDSTHKSINSEIPND